MTLPIRTALCSSVGSVCVPCFHCIYILSSRRGGCTCTALLRSCRICSVLSFQIEIPSLTNKQPVPARTIHAYIYHPSRSPSLPHRPCKHPGQAPSKSTHAGLLRGISTFSYLRVKGCPSNSTNLAQSLRKAAQGAGSPAPGGWVTSFRHRGRCRFSRSGTSPACQPRHAGHVRLRCCTG